MGKFYVCEHCKSVVELICDGGAPLVCCGETLKELTPYTTQTGAEKHLPDIYVEGDVVTVQLGSVPHPMIEEHLIQWIQLETDRGCQRKWLKAGDEPVVRFSIRDEKPIAVYAYCNLHGLWKAGVEKA